MNNTKEIAEMFSQLGKALKEMSYQIWMSENSPSDFGHERTKIECNKLIKLADSIRDKSYSTF